MTISGALNAYLKSKATLTALTDTRIYPDAAPQDVTTFPVLVHRRVDGDETPYLSGEANDLHRDTFELEVIGPVRDDCDAVCDVLLTLFAGITPRGMWHSTIFVSGCIPSRTSTTTEPPVDASERRDRESSVSLTVIWGRR